MRILFKGYKHVTGTANALGYQSASSNLYRALQEHPDVSLGSEGALFHLHFCNPMNYEPVEGARNVLYTMMESDPPPSYFDTILSKDRPEAIIVPSRFCQVALAPLSSKLEIPVMVAPLGFDPKRFKPVLREHKENERFLFLWVGAPNGRKGPAPVIRAWDLGLAMEESCFMYFKTTDPDGEGRIQHVGRNVIFDSRYLSEAEMDEIYSEAHCLVAPSQGEGFGLPMLEAMASGLPVITVDWTAPPEFLKDDACYVDYEVQGTRTDDGEKFNAAVADRVDLLRKMTKLIRGYPMWAKRAHRGAKRLHLTHTWGDSAEYVIDCLRRLLRS